VDSLPQLIQNILQIKHIPGITLRIPQSNKYRNYPLKSRMMYKNRNKLKYPNPKKTRLKKARKSILKFLKSLLSKAVMGRDG
jgi:hypothetical protein